MGIAYMPEFETGTCTYTVKWKVYTQTSGTELRGPDVLYGEYASELDATYALTADEKYLFSRDRWFPTTWRSKNGYTTAYITRTVEYDFK